MDQPRTPAPVLSESTVLRKLNLTQHRAGKLRAAGVLVPDFITEGYTRLYQPSRLNALALAVQQFTASPATNPKA